MSKESARKKRRRKERKRGPKKDRTFPIVPGSFKFEIDGVQHFGSADLTAHSSRGAKCSACGGFVDQGEELCSTCRVRNAIDDRPRGEPALSVEDFCDAYERNNH